MFLSSKADTESLVIPGSLRSNIGQLTEEELDMTSRQSKAAPGSDTSHIQRSVGTIQDISRAKQLEDQFQQSQRIAAIGVLAGGIAHDLNNLLTAINCYSDLTLERMNDKDPLRLNIEEIKRAGSRAADLTSQLLAFGRRQVFNLVVLNLNSVIADLEKMLICVIRERVELRLDLAADLGNVKADPAQVEQVLINLTINARDAMLAGGTLTIGTRNVELSDEYISPLLAADAGKYVEITVTDTGHGIDPSVRPHIFEPFFTTKEVGKGTGLGLSMAYGIVKQFGGDMVVFSEVGEGTTFKIYLPCVDESLPRTKWVGKKEQEFAGTETILVVEDEDLVRKLVCEILTSHGYTVLEAESAKTALSISSTYPGSIDMILTDVIMPKMGGPRLKMEVQKHRPAIKVLFMSGYAHESIVHREAFASGVDFIQKPFTPDGLAKKLRDVFGDQ